MMKFFTIFMRFLFKSLLSLGFLLVAIFISISLYSYNVFDPSPFVITNTAPENILGIYGSWTSSILISLLGVVSWIFVFSLVLISRLFFLKELYQIRVLLRLFIAIFACILLSISTAAFDFETGLISKLIVTSINSSLSEDYKYVSNFIYLFISLVGFYAFIWSADIKIIKITTFFYNKLKVSLYAVSILLKKLNILIFRKKIKKIKIKKAFFIKNIENKSKVLPSGKSIKFILPNVNLLSEGKELKREISSYDLEKTARLLENVLDEFGVKGSVSQIEAGPIVTRYELEPAPGTRSSRVIGLSDDIARSMSAISARVSVIPGRNAIGIELPNKNRELVKLRTILDSKLFRVSSGLALALGKDIAGEVVIADLGNMPHLLIAGTTGSGKSVAVNAMILSLVYNLRPDECKFIMIDPKMLELSVYEDIPYLLHPVVTDPRKAVYALKWTVREMNERYKQMSILGVRNIDSYNKKIDNNKKAKKNFERTIQTGFDHNTGKPVYEKQDIAINKLPLIVVIVDEMADLMLTAGKEIEISIQSLAQKARAAGIHLILATQRPSVDVITGTIKANLPYRISFQVTSKIDSRTILGEQGAEQLLGKGDMLYMRGGGHTERVHGPFVSDDEVYRVANYLRSQGEPEYIHHITEDNDSQLSLNDNSAEQDEMFEKALDLITRERKVSTSFLQRHLAIGYNRAARIIDALEHKGMISSANTLGRREVLIPDDK